MRSSDGETFFRRHWKRSYLDRMAKSDDWTADSEWVYAYEYRVEGDL